MTVTVMERQMYMGMRDGFKGERGGVWGVEGEVGVGIGMGGAGGERGWVWVWGCE